MKGGSQPHNPRDGEEETDPDDQGEGKAQAPRVALLSGGEPARKNCDEHHVVDAEDDFHCGERDQSDETFGGKQDI